MSITQLLIMSVVLFILGGAAVIIGIILGAAIATPDKKNENSGEDLTYNQETLAKVYRALIDNGLLQPKANDVIDSMQNAGILFRERKN